MGDVKEISIKSAYHYLEDMIDIKDFHSNLLSIEKNHMDMLIFIILVTSKLKNLVIIKIFIV